MSWLICNVLVPEIDTANAQSAQNTPISDLKSTRCNDYILGTTEKPILPWCGLSIVRSGQYNSLWNSLLS